MRGTIKFLFILIFLAVLYYVRQYMTYQEVRKDSLPFAIEAVNRIAAAWNVAEFNTLALAPMKNTVAAKFTECRKLGTPLKPASCTLRDFTSYKYKNPPGTYRGATYQCDVEFQNGPAFIELIIVRLPDAGWKIFYFDVIAPYISQINQSRRP